MRGFFLALALVSALALAPAPALAHVRVRTSAPKAAPPAPPPPPPTQSFCFPRAYGPESNPICLSWTRDGADFVFGIVCTPDSFPFLSLSWCAIGFSTATPPSDPMPPFAPSMFPSEIVHLQLVNASAGGGEQLSVVLTDRVAVAVSLPGCAATQHTRLLNASVDADTGELSAFFARRAELPRAALAEGYTQLNRTLPVIAAISNGGALAAGGCAASFAPHDNEWGLALGRLINFASERR
jgi:hypothetical protein